MRYWTDYPIVELGDKPRQKAPIREIEVISYDGNKYCYIKVGGIETEIKWGYIYTQPGRLGEVPAIKIEDVRKLPEQSIFDNDLK